MGYDKGKSAKEAAMFYYDPSYILVLIGAIISAVASWNVRSTFEKYNRRACDGRTGRDVAEQILRSAGIHDVRIEMVQGSLSDHYSPKDKVLRLSESVYHSASISAIGVAAHECGHAIQHREDYLPLKLRSLSVPAANFGSWLSWPLILLGLLLGFGTLAELGVVLFTLVVLFQLITLPVEFNASRRAMAALESQGLLRGDDLQGAGKVLNAAALTYVAALFAAILQLLRLMMIVGGRRRDD